MSWDTVLDEQELPAVRQSDFKIEDILQVDVEDGQSRLTIGDCREDKGEVLAWSQGCPVFGVDGFYSVPIGYDENGACQAYMYNDGVQEVCLGTYDNRWMANAGNLEPGDRAVLTRGPARILIKENKDSVTLYTEGQGGAMPDDANSMMVALDGSNDSLLLSVGKCCIEITNDKIQFTAAGGKTTMVIDEQGVQINGGQFICATKGGCLGTIGPQAPPIPVANAILLGPSGMAGIAATNWTIAPA